MTAKPLATFGASEVFSILRNGKPRTRAELSAQTGFARSTVTARIDSLLKLGFVCPVSLSPSTGGRPPARVAFNPGARIVAAADIGATHATVALANLSGKTLVATQEMIDVSLGPKKVLDWLVERVEDLLQETKRPTAEMIAIGIGLPGPVEFSSGKPSNPPIMPGWDGFDVPDYVRRSFDVPVLVDNDVNIMALGEREVCWPDVDDMIFLKIATGIGAGIISGGELQHGAEGSAGDVGHVPVSRAAGILCRCGNTGCLEAIAGSPTIAAVLRQQGINASSGIDIVNLVRKGDLNAIQVMRQVGRDVGEMLNTCVSIVNPSLVVVGGSMAQAGEHLIAGIREAVYARSMPLATQHLSIVQSQIGTEAGIVGAGIMAVNYVLSPERIEALTSI
ncbi:ROK family protein [Arthrobacter pigmenti]